MCEDSRRNWFIFAPVCFGWATTGTVWFAIWMQTHGFRTACDSMTRRVAYGASEVVEEYQTKYVHVAFIWRLMVPWLEYQCLAILVTNGSFQLAPYAALNGALCIRSLQETRDVQVRVKWKVDERNWVWGDGWTQAGAGYKAEEVPRSVT